MEMILDRKNRIPNSVAKKRKFEYLDDILLEDYYSNHFQNLSSEELNNEFNKDIRYIAKALGNIPEKERKEYIEMLSKIFMHYFENNIEKEIEESISKILKF